MQQHNLFISFSGARSLFVARKLREWLPMVIQSAHPWLSDADLDPGARSLNGISEALAGTKLGISCLTPENLTKPWILFEAGALTKTVDDKTRLFTFLIDGLQPEEVPPPLGMFQATRAEKEPTRKLVHTINRALNDTPLADAVLNRLFEMTWPDLEKDLAQLPPAEENNNPKRSSEDMIAELLEITRAEAIKRRKIDPLDAFLPLFEELLPLLPRFQHDLRRFKLSQPFGLPTLPSADYPQGSQILNIADGKHYRNIGEGWHSES